MSQEIINPIQNISYTSKDFETVYPEILDLVKTLTYKWDPSISNESDPGVILIKLLAILEDKCNYNIDKNILEAFPISVTQNTNARQLFAQLGYFMHWYNSSTTNVTVKWIGGTSEQSYYTIPAFTMVSDEDATVVYTLVGPSANTSTATFNVGDQKLKTDGTELSFKAIQGIAVDYDVAGNTLITYDYLDNDNRLYFDTIDIAENGIFICNSGQNNYKAWERKDNLLVEPLGNYYYRFGVTSDASKCYIEFPSDAEKLFQEGINITYIKTDGSNGNVAARVLSKFYNDLIPAESSDIQLTTSNVQIYNPSAGTGGVDPQDIDDAYNDYMRTVGTFDTLVTLRDYINKIYETGLVSNDFVCDRTNDIQSVYTIQATVNDLDQPQNIIESTVKYVTPIGSETTVPIEEPMLNAYDLKLYLLQPSTNLTALLGYKQTFKMMTEAQTANVKAVIEDFKSIQHDYQDILPITSTQSHFCYFINAYPVNWEVKTQYALSNSAWEEILTNIKNALYENLNASQINFGDEIDPDYLYKVIMNADKRIKTVYKKNINYLTYAVYYDGTNYKRELINDNGNSYFTDSVTGTCSNTGMAVKVDFTTYTTKIGSTYDYSTLTFKYDGTQWKLNDTAVALSTYGITITKGTPVNGDTIATRISLANQFRDEIYTKSALAGKTQFFVKDELFDYRLNQSMTNFFNDEDDPFEQVEGNVTVKFNGINTDKTLKKYELKTNETIRLYAPNLIDDTTYSDYVRVTFYSESSKTIAADESYQLGDNQYVTFYWKETTDSNYSFACYGKGNIICPKNCSITSDTDDKLHDSITLVDLEAGNSTYSRLGLSGLTSNDQTEFVAGLGTAAVLSGNKSATVQKANQIILDKSNGYYCYWITDNYWIDEETNIKHYVLFEDGEDEKILNYNEYFLYANSTLTNMIALGVGSKITRTDKETSAAITSGEWSVIATDPSNILTEGVSFLTDNDLWFNLTGNNQIRLTENQFSTVNTGYTFNLTPTWTDDTYTSWLFEFNKNGSYGIRYSLTSIQEANISFELEKLYDKLSKTSVNTFTYDGSNWKFGTETYTKDQLKTLLGIDVTSPTSGCAITIIPITLTSFTISYTDTSNITTTINQILSNIGEWEGNSILNIYVDSTNEMPVLSNQVVTFTKVSGDEQEIVGADAVTPKTGPCNYPVVILSSHEIKNSTTSAVPCYVVDDTTVTYPTVYQFKKYYNNSTSDDNVSYTSDGTVLLTFEHSETATTVSNSINFNIPAGNYILGLVNNYVEDVEDLYVKLDEVLVKPMYNKSMADPDLSAQGVYYLYLPVTALSSGEHTLVVSMANPDETKNLLLYNPYKYKKPVVQYRPFEDDDGNTIYMSDADFAKYEELIKRFDTNHIFNYTYEVSSEVEIPRPCEAETFNNSNHIFNQFTICAISDIDEDAIRG